MHEVLESKILVLGVGNPLRHDDGIGSAIIKKLHAQNDSRFDLVDGGTDGLALLDIIGKYKQVIIIDAVLMEEEPGVVRFFTPDEARIKIQNDVLSTHGFGIAQVLQLMVELEIKAQVTIIGVQPKDIGFGEGLSKEVVAQIPLILDWIKSFLK